MAVFKRYCQAKLNMMREAQAGLTARPTKTAQLRHSEAQLSIFAYIFRTVNATRINPWNEEQRWKDLSGEAGGTRTRGPRLKRPLLYRLSYRPVGVSSLYGSGATPQVPNASESASRGPFGPPVRAFALHCSIVTSTNAVPVRWSTGGAS